MKRIRRYLAGSSGFIVGRGLAADELRGGRGEREGEDQE